MEVPGQSGQGELLVLEVAAVGAHFLYWAAVDFVYFLAGLKLIPKVPYVSFL